MIKISASILTADLTNLESEVLRVKKSGADWLHIDVMDGKFVPPLTIGDVVVNSLRRKFGCDYLTFDTHLMVSAPTPAMIANFAAAGSDYITIHVESKTRAIPQDGLCSSEGLLDDENKSDVRNLLEQIRLRGCKAGLAINPPTPIERAFDYIGLADMFLIMSVNPGYGGQAFIPESIGKIAALRKEIDARGANALIQVDGGINAETAPAVIDAGADILVTGSYLFNAADMAEAVRLIVQPRH
jgi:ribulose-phosphate 3-epimerase